MSVYLIHSLLSTFLKNNLLNIWPLFALKIISKGLNRRLIGKFNKVFIFCFTNIALESNLNLVLLLVGVQGDHTDDTDKQPHLVSCQAIPTVGANAFFSDQTLR